MQTQPNYITVSNLARRFPGTRGAKHLHPATITRWILQGVTGMDGTVIRLRAHRLGGKWLITEADLQEFMPALGSQSNAPEIRTPAVRTRASNSAADQLERMGC